MRYGTTFTEIKTYKKHSEVFYVFGMFFLFSKENANFAKNN